MIKIEIRGDGTPKDDNGFIYRENGELGLLNSDYDLIAYIYENPEL